MEIKEYINLRDQLIENSLDEDGVFSEDSFLAIILPDLMEVKMIDSEDINFSYVDTILDDHQLKINGYTINETGERLQVFVVNEKTTSLKLNSEDLMIKTKENYQTVFSKSLRFVKSSMKRHLELHDSDSAGFLVQQLGNNDFIKDIEVIEIFLITPSITVETRGNNPSLKKMTFSDEEIKATYSLNREKKEKDILIVKKLIDLNFLYDISVSKGYKYALEVNFDEVFNQNIEVLKAADEENFESYLCVLPAQGLAELYRRYSTRLLEKNVRSFLNFRVEANSAMRETIKNTPERFIAYNNGLTITATNKDLISENGKLYLKSLIDFQIVNGGQTTASIFFSKKDGLDISKINLMAKINIAKNISDEELNELISNISLYSNTQSKVSKVDLKSRNPQIDKIKSLSNSIVSPQGNKWFFEKSRGEFSTMIRLAGGNKKRIEKDYPKEQRLTKTELGKYYTAWGGAPWLVKKGGEKVFRSFIEKISGEGIWKKPIEMNRGFYEILIATAILFRKLERIHGTRNNALGQLRSAVVPYSISILHHMFGGTERRDSKFDLSTIWKNQDLSDDLIEFFRKLMILQYSLIKKYATSDDLGENTKKEELWDKIKKSAEIKEFTSSEDALKILKKYTSKDIKSKIYKEVDFNDITDAVELLSKGKKFYSELQSGLNNSNKEVESFNNKTYTRYLDKMYPKKGGADEMNIIQIQFFNKLFKELKENSPELLDNLIIHNNDDDDSEIFYLKITLNKIIKIYNIAVSENKDIESEFNALSALADLKKVKYASSIATIGRKLGNGIPPALKDLHLASNFFQVKTGLKKKEQPTPKTKISKLSLFDNLNDKTNESNIFTKRYLKLICNQDIERTPSIGSKAVEQVLEVNLNKGESKHVDFYIENRFYAIELSKRNTRNEYRFFMNKIRNDFHYNEGDIIEIYKTFDRLCLNIISKPLNGNEAPTYNKFLEKLEGKFHIII